MTSFRFFLFLALVVSLARPVLAQEDAATYRVADVVADVTAASAPVAREQAIVQAQRHAFEALLERLGATPAQARASDEALAALVQAFEIKKEHAAGLRYTGSFSVQFKPQAVRQWLETLGVGYTETRARPFVVLPIVKDRDRTVLWEDRTLWRDAWAQGDNGAGLVPFVLPAGELEDIALISPAEALAGKAEALQALAQKYGAGGVLLALWMPEGLEGDDKGAAMLEGRLYDETGTVMDGAAPLRARHEWASPTQRDAALGQALKAQRDFAETRWRAANKIPSGEAVRLPVDAAVPTLAAWTRLQKKLAALPGVASAQVVTMTRGLVHFELVYRGDFSALQSAAASGGLFFQQGPSGGWLLNEAP